MMKIRKNQKGFTLIELLIVVAIIGILAAIAIPQFSQYRQRGYASAVRADVKNAYTAVTVWFSDNPNVANCPAAAGTTGPAVLDAANYPSANVSNGVTVAVAAGTDTTFTVTGSHAQLPAGNSYVMAANGTITDNL